MHSCRQQTQHFPMYQLDYSGCHLVFHWPEPELSPSQLGFPRCSWQPPGLKRGWDWMHQHNASILTSLLVKITGHSSIFKNSRMFMMSFLALTRSDISIPAWCPCAPPTPPFFGISGAGGQNTAYILWSRFTEEVREDPSLETLLGVPAKLVCLPELLMCSTHQVSFGEGSFVLSGFNL